MPTKTTALRAVTYTRVSTVRQERSGLGLAAQQTAVTDWCRANGADVVGQFVEAESGSRADRQQLARALAACRRHGARLVVAKLDRLSRSVAFLATLRESGVPFTVCDNPHATPLTLDILSAVAEDEVRRTRERTCAALAAAKARGTQLGHTATLTEAGRAKGRTTVLAVRSERFDVWAARYGRQVAKLRQRAGSLRELAAELEAADLPTPTGGYAWHSMAVSRMLARLDTRE